MKYPLITYLASALLFSIVASLGAEPDAINFNRDIRPILSDKCFHCHGPDEKKREEDLRLDIPDGELGALTPREDYYIIKPGEPEESELWFRIISEYDDEIMPPEKSRKPALTQEEVALFKRWIEEGAAYQDFWAFVAPEKAPLATINNTAWNDHAIDNRVMAQLEAKGLQPKPEADKRTLIRRLSFDLTGLPPTLEEIETFLSDSSPNAYEALVDRLLGSPAYGEHMTRYWADLVRLGDTNGMHKDFHREFSPYRDWLIRSFNSNLPFDQFITYQLAGDLYSDPSRDQLIASGFNRLHLIIDKGTALPEESLHKNVLDRVEAFGTTFLGMTVQCASCHDHKYDPITRKDYYQLYAFFNNFSGAAETVNTPERGLEPPFINLTTPKQEQRLAEFDANKRRLEYELESTNRAQRFTEKWPDSFKKVAVPWIWDGDQLQAKSVAFRPALQLEKAPDVAIVRYTGSTSAKVSINGTELPEARSTDGAIIADATNLLKSGDNEILAEANGKAGFAFILEYRIGTDESKLVSNSQWESKARGSSNWKPARVVQGLKGNNDWTAKVRSAEIHEINRQQAALEKRRKTFLADIPAAMIMSELDPPRKATLLLGGAYDAPGEPVERNTPAFLPPMRSKKGMYTRMDLAEWLVAPNHPLTARVAVNRFWQQLFGVGLVKTSEDFGAQGEWPSHPQLLDDLAAGFIDSGWNVKQLIRSIVVSKTYKQSSNASPSEYKADPDNRQLARGSRYRMDAEMIRDQILAISGQLNRTMYGKSVKPPQPPGLWEMVSMAEPKTYVADTNDNIYRRSLYTYWRRGMPPPQMTIMNAPSREFCVARRERTNTPLQALLLMNEEEWFKAAKATAQGILQQKPSDDQGLSQLYEKITSYRLEPDRLEQIKSALADFKDLYSTDRSLTESLTPDLASAPFGQRVEVAAWTMVTHSLFNLELAKTRR